MFPILWLKKLKTVQNSLFWLGGWYKKPLNIIRNENLKKVSSYSGQKEIIKHSFRLKIYYLTRYFQLEFCMTKVGRDVC